MILISCPILLYLMLNDFYLPDEMSLVPQSMENPSMLRFAYLHMITNLPYVPVSNIMVFRQQDKLGCAGWGASYW